MDFFEKSGRLSASEIDYFQFQATSDNFPDDRFYVVTQSRNDVTCNRILNRSRALVNNTSEQKLYLRT